MLLGISESANETEIKKEYRKKTLKYPPDKNIKNKDEAEEMFKKITDAYKILLNTNA